MSEENDEIRALQIGLARLDGKLETIEVKALHGDKEIRQVISLVEAQVLHVLDNWKEFKELIKSLNGRLDTFSTVLHRIDSLENRLTAVENHLEAQDDEINIFRGGKAAVLVIAGAIWTLTLTMIQIWAATK